jgi:hypothetical protein
VEAISPDASTFKTTNALSGHDLHDLKLSRRAMKVAAEGKDVGKVFDEAKSRRVYRELLLVTHSLIYGEGNCLTPFGVHFKPIASEAIVCAFV